MLLFLDTGHTAFGQTQLSLISFVLVRGDGQRVFYTELSLFVRYTFLCVAATRRGLGASP
jgi:hypothetical protein